ncbi:MAG: hypothetical protein HFG38_09730 [Eubacterium sp.]|jgi:tetratricopeptide (TPR) repeat protein|nr:hypothetical protein [Eubacterium sp.]
MKFILIYFVCFCIFCAWLFYEQRKSQRQQKKASDDFWAREALANSTRKKDISDLPLIRVEEKEIPFIETQEESIITYIGQLRQIIQEPMADLSDYSNTDLKLAYGVANFKTLSEYDENFNTFLVTLTNLARSYERNGYHEQARDTYLTALRHGSRRAGDYEELAKIWLELGRRDEVKALIRRLEESSHPRRAGIISKLNQVLADHR